MLDRRFSLDPMMDWTGTSQKAKCNQHLSPITKNHAVPNAVPIWFEACAGDLMSQFGVHWVTRA